LKVLALILCLGLVLTFAFSFSADYSEYVDVIRKHYESRASSKEAISSWKEGAQEEYRAILDHLICSFEFVDGFETTEGKIVISGILTTTAYCTRDGYKIRIHQLYGMAIVMAKDKKFEKFLKLTEVNRIVEVGWNGKDV
jgi:hypothetical protein